MVARRYGIFPLVFNSTCHSWAIKLNTWREILYLRAPVYYSLFNYLCRILRQHWLFSKFLVIGHSWWKSPVCNCKGWWWRNTVGWFGRCYRRTRWRSWGNGWNIPDATWNSYRVLFSFIQFFFGWLRGKKGRVSEIFVPQKTKFDG